MESPWVSIDDNAELRITMIGCPCCTWCSMVLYQPVLGVTQHQHKLWTNPRAQSQMDKPWVASSSNNATHGCHMDVTSRSGTKTNNETLTTPNPCWSKHWLGEPGLARRIWTHTLDWCAPMGGSEPEFVKSNQRVSKPTVNGSRLEELTKSRSPTSTKPPGALSRR